MIALLFFLTGLFFVGTTAHLVPMLVERGVAADRAAYLMPFVGVALTIGRIISGYLMDRFFAPYVVLVTLLAPAVAFLLFLIGLGPATAPVALFLFGLAFGAEMDVMAYFVSRYFGAKYFGQIHGYIFGIFYIGAGPGPLLMGLAYDVFGSYRPALIVFLSAALLCSALMLLLPRYRTPNFADTGGAPDSS